MKTDVKNLVKTAYSKIVTTGNSGCGCGCGTADGSIIEIDPSFKVDYSKVEGWQADADYGLGCGLPTETAAIKEGDTVVDLGSGAGNDVFVASRIVGPAGKVIGVDMTEAMIGKANHNKRKPGYTNVEFVLGDIENMPVETSIADVVVSNCVINLVPDKKKAFAEIYRILKPGGHFSISDIVYVGNLPEAMKKSIELYASCVAGALQKDEYIAVVEKAGFKNIKIVKERKYDVPDGVMRKYLSDTEIKEYIASGSGVLSITVYAEK